MRYRIFQIKRMIKCNAKKSIMGIYGWIQLSACQLKLFNLHAFYSNKYDTSVMAICLDLIMTTSGQAGVFGFLLEWYMVDCQLLSA